MQLFKYLLQSLHKIENIPENCYFKSQVDFADI
jgi:hypothetical protein